MKLKEVVELLNGSIISEMALKHFDKKVIDFLKNGEIDSAVDAYVSNAESNGEEVLGGKARPTITFKTIRQKIQDKKIDVDEETFDKFEEKILEKHKGRLKPKKTAKEKKEESSEQEAEEIKEIPAATKKVNLIKKPKIKEDI